MAKTKYIQAGERTQHTPGPWTQSDNGAGVRYLFGPELQNLATISALCDGKDNAARIRESISNARLIAAAPELLEIVQILNRWQRLGQYPLRSIGRERGRRHTRKTCELRYRQSRRQITWILSLTIKSLLTGRKARSSQSREIDLTLANSEKPMFSQFKLALTRAMVSSRESNWKSCPSWH